jgi:hypothetical protein
MSSAVLAQQIGRWSASEIHDTVSAIARQPMYATSIRESVLGRFFRFVIGRIARFLAIFDGAGDPSLLIIVTLSVVVLVIASRIIVTRRAADIQRRLGGRVQFGRIAARDHWGDARAAALAGDYLAATHALYAAVIDSLARAGVVAFHPSKTSGDYAREMIRRGDAPRQEFRTFARDADRVIFGTRQPTAADYDRLLAAAERAVRPPAAA